MMSAFPSRLRASAWGALFLLLAAVPARAQLPPDAFEPNEAIGEARLIGPGTYAGAISEEADQDWFAVDMAGGDALLVFAEFEQARGDLDARILNHEGTPLSSGITSTDNERVFWLGNEGERLFIRVNGFLGGVNDYVLTVEVLPNGGVPLADDFREDDDAPDLATPAADVGPSERLALLDEDWFRFDVDENDTIAAFLSFIDRIGDIDALLLDAEGREVAAATSGSNDELLIAEFVPAGTYWLKIYGYEDDKNFYDLTLSVEPAAGPARMRVPRPAAEAFPSGGSARLAGSAPSAGPLAGGPLAKAPRRTLREEKAVEDIVPGEFLVKWESAESLGAFRSAARSQPLGFSVEARVLNPGALAREASSPPTREAARPWTLLRWRDPDLGRSSKRQPSLADEEAMRSAKALPGVASIEPNRYWRTAEDYYPPEQNMAQAPYYIASGLPGVWGRSLGEGVVIAVIDTGAALGHPELAPNIWRNEREADGLPGVDDDANGYIDDITGWDFVAAEVDFAAEGEDIGPPDADPTDRQGHGTAVAGVALAAEGNPSITGDPEASNMVGVAPRAKLMPLRAGFATSSGPGLLRTSDWVEALYYAADNGAQVVNMSFTSSQLSEAARDAVNRARQRGCVIVGAAGNEGFYFPRYPAAFEGVVSVGSVDLRLKKSGFSNFGPWVGAMSFGENVLVPWREGGYARASGTSFASPMVAGMAALLISEWGLSPAEVESRLAISAQDIVPLNVPFLHSDFGWGLARPDLARQALEQEERGEVVRFGLENGGFAPGRAVLGPPPAPFGPGKIWFDEPSRVLPGGRRLAVFETLRDPAALGGVWRFELAPEAFGAPPSLAFLKVLPETAAPFQVAHEETFGDAWTARPVIPSPLAPFESGAVRTEGGALVLEASGPSRLAIAQGPNFEALGTGGLLVAEFEPGAASLGPGTGVQFRLHGGDWNSMASAWLRNPAASGQARTGAGVVRVILPEGPSALASGLSAGADLLAGPESLEPSFLRVESLRVRLAPLPDLDAAARLDFEGVPSLAGGWLASPLSGEGFAPASAEDVPGGIRLALDGPGPAGAYAETPPMVLKPGRLYRARFVVRAEGSLDWRDRPALQAYAYRTDGTSARSRLWESLPGTPDQWLSEAPGAFDLFVRSTPDGLGAGEVRFAVGPQSSDPAGTPGAAVAVERFSLTSVPDPLGFLAE